jgi:hypothetical protein
MDHKVQLNILKRTSRAPTTPGAMPQGGPPLNNDEYDALAAYIDALK